MNICVFLSAADLDERYTRPAREFAELIGKGGHTLVWGGSDSGLMKVVADGVQESGGRLVGISVEFLRHLARTDADEMVFAKDLAERKALLLARSDAVVVMAGGLGTLDEATEILELRKHGMHDQDSRAAQHRGFLRGVGASACTDGAGRVPAGADGRPRLHRRRRCGCTRPSRGDFPNAVTRQTGPLWCHRVGSISSAPRSQRPQSAAAWYVVRRNSSSVASGDAEVRTAS